MSLIHFDFTILFKALTTQTLKVCRTPGPSLKLLLKVWLKRWRKEKKSMTGPG